MHVWRFASFICLSSCSLVAFTGCSASSTTTTTTTTTPTTTTTTTPTTTTTTTATNTGTDLTKLPLGDGKLSTSAQSGYVFSCQTTFSSTGGAAVAGPWIDSTDGTFDFTAKTVVQGSVAWPTHSLTITLNGASRTVSTNDLPNHNTGTFPIAALDPAHAYDGNPNSIASQTILYSLVANPVAAATPTCLSGGPIGVLLSGALLFDALDGEGRDAVAHELQDSCQGHPQQSDEYHYHNLTSCISDPGTGHSNLLGYALDGYGVFGVRGESGQVLTNADLDACHGHTESIPWDGQTVTMYHYHATYAYPYTLGCFHGTPATPNSISTALIAPHVHNHPH